MKNHIVFIIILACLFPGTSFAQGNLEKLTRLQGSWHGEGFQQMGQNEREEFSHEEEVTVLMDGKLIMFHGTGFGKDTGDKGFEAVGVMYHDATENQTFIYAWTLDGRYTRANVEVTDDGFVWGFDVDNGGKVKYEATISDTSWNEQGLYSPDGSTWYPFMETRLTRN